MKKLSIITEGILGDMIRRDLAGEKRKEDVVGNIKKIQPIDIGCSVLWADRDLEVNGEYSFTFDEAMNFVKNSEWRLPTLEEVAELDDNFVLDYKKGTYLFYKNKHIIKFEPRGIYYKIYKITKYNLVDPKLYYGWTSTSLSIENNQFTNKVHVFAFDENQFYHTPLNKIDFENIVVQSKFDKICIRLVKEK